LVVEEVWSFGLHLLHLSELVERIGVDFEVDVESGGAMMATGFVR
jgi:4-diphosphocytidyl-2C-methyl-D-erythritol kinase